MFSFCVVFFAVQSISIFKNVAGGYIKSYECYIMCSPETS